MLPGSVNFKAFCHLTFSKFHSTELFTGLTLCLSHILYFASFHSSQVTQSLRQAVEACASPSTFGAGVGRRISPVRAGEMPGDPLTRVSGSCRDCTGSNFHHHSRMKGVGNHRLIVVRRARREEAFADDQCSLHWAWRGSRAWEPALLCLERWPEALLPSLCSQPTKQSRGSFLDSQSAVYI